MQALHERMRLRKEGGGRGGDSLNIMYAYDLRNDDTNICHMYLLIEKAKIIVGMLDAFERKCSNDAAPGFICSTATQRQPAARREPANLPSCTILELSSPM